MILFSMKNFYLLLLVFFIVVYINLSSFCNNPFLLWITVCLERVVIIAPFTFDFDESNYWSWSNNKWSKMGDNTLGMSLALIPIYYLIIKLLNNNEFS